MNVVWSQIHTPWLARLGRRYQVRIEADLVLGTYHEEL